MNRIVLLTQLLLLPRTDIHTGWTGMYSIIRLYFLPQIPILLCVCVCSMSEEMGIVRREIGRNEDILISSHICISTHPQIIHSSNSTLMLPGLAQIPISTSLPFIYYLINLLFNHFLSIAAEASMVHPQKLNIHVRTCVRPSVMGNACRLFRACPCPCPCPSLYLLQASGV